VSDLYHGKVIFHGVVDGSGRHGSAFALIPAQTRPANWIKGGLQRRRCAFVWMPESLPSAARWAVDEPRLSICAVTRKSIAATYQGDPVSSVPMTLIAIRL